MWNIDELLNKLDIDFTRLHDLLVYDPHAPMILNRSSYRIRSRECRTRCLIRVPGIQT